MGKHARKMVFLFGPTAVGKTDLLVKLFSCGSVPSAEVISADSMQVYRHMDIGSAKPSAELRERFPHHLIDIRNPNEQFHAGDFVTLADALADDIAATGRIPVVSGGTAFYFRNLLFGLPGTPAGNPETRALLREREAVVGTVGLYDDLLIIDPETAGRIDRNDRYRIIRALEVYYSSGLPLSSFTLPNTPREDLGALIIGLDRPRPDLYERIDRRVDKMFGDGLPAEVQALLDMGYLPSDPGFRGIGYREFWEQFSEETQGGPADFASWVSSLGAEEIRRLKDRIRQSSRRYAKRQLTFFRQLPDVRWFDPDSTDELADAIAVFWKDKT